MEQVGLLVEVLWEALVSAILAQITALWVVSLSHWQARLNRLRR